GNALGSDAGTGHADHERDDGPSIGGVRCDGHPRRSPALPRQELRRLTRARLGGELHEAAKRIGEPHVIDRAAVDLEQPWRADEVREALRPGDGNVEPVAREEEVEAPRYILAA